MAKQPPSEKKPDDNAPREPGQQGDDLLSDSSIEELDLESLLADDFIEEASRAPIEEGSDSPRDAKKAGSGAGASNKGAVVDDGEIDLLSDGVLEEAEPVTADDLLGMDDTVDEVADDPKTFAAEGATNGQKISVGEAPGDIFEEVPELATDNISEIDLLADDSDPTPTQAAEATSASVAAAAAAGAVASGAAAAAREPGKGFLKPGKRGSKPESGAEARKETVPMGEAKEEPEEGAGRASDDPAESPREEPSGKSGKRSKAAKKEKPKKGTVKKDAKVRDPRRDENRPAAAARLRGSVAFVCSECYEEFLLPSNYSQEMVSCPECLHVGKRPDEGFLRTVSLHKAGERKSFILALAAGVALLVLALGLLWLTSDMHLAQNPGKKPDSNLVLGLLGGGGLLAALFVWLSVRFEGNRWEVYF